MTKKEFWIRLVAFAIFACILPFVFIAWRYSIFKKVTSISLNGWGLIAILIVILFVRYVAKVIEKQKRWSWSKQIFLGILKVIVPLVCLYVGLSAMKSNIDLFLQALIVVIGCEAVAIVVNPLPQWAMENDISFFKEIMKKGDTE